MRIAQGTTIDERYRLERPLGSGGMAIVWLASDERLGREVAVKLLSDTLVVDADFVQRFEREARIAAGLSHPALVPVHDLGIWEERPYLVMEYVEGETLGKRLDRGGDVDARILATEMLGALEHIHEAGIIHRDVKPDNILFADDGRIRLTDFGIARISGSSQLTQTGQVLGTLRYMSPEIREGGEASAAADLYALGVVLADCGEPSDAELSHLIGSLRSADPARRPVSARAALRRLRHSSPGAGTAATEVSAVTRVLESQPEAETDGQPETRSRPAPEQPPEPATEPTPAEPRPTRPPAAVTPPPARSRRGPIAVAAGLALALAVGLGLLLLGGSDEPGGSGNQGREQARSQEEGSGSSGSSDGAGTEQPATDEPAPADEEPAAPTSEDAAALDAEGYDLIQAGRPDEAIPILERAVAAAEADPESETYAFALFNYGWALRLAGRPEDAIPILEQRLQIDNQRDVVRAELKRARADANQ